MSILSAIARPVKTDVITIKGADYAVEAIPAGECGVSAVRLVKLVNGESYDLLRHHDGLVECTCPDYELRRKGTGQPCKHGATCMAQGLLPVVAPVAVESRPVTEMDIKRAHYFGLNIPKPAPLPSPVACDESETCPAEEIDADWSEDDRWAISDPDDFPGDDELFDEAERVEDRFVRTASLARRPKVVRPDLRDITPARFRVVGPKATMMIAYGNSGYFVRVGWIGESQAFRLEDDETGEIATVTNEFGSERCSCSARKIRKSCNHLEAVRSAFLHTGELPAETPASEHYPRKTWYDGYVPTEGEDAEWLGYTVGLSSPVSAEGPEGWDSERRLHFGSGLWAGRADRWAAEDAELAEWVAEHETLMEAAFSGSDTGPRETDGYRAGYTS